MAPSRITGLLGAVRSGDPDAEEELLSAVYGELHRLAASRMRRERQGHTLQPTALVHETYLRLVGGEAGFENRAHFFAAAAEAMRRILIEHARRVVARKRGGGAERVTFDEMKVEVDSVDGDVDILELDRALRALEEFDGRLAEVVRLRYFTGLTVEETAEVTGRSRATVKRDWAYARAWLLERMNP